MAHYSINSNKREVISYFSYLRIFACLGIIILHTVFSSILMYGNSITVNQYSHAMMICNNLMWAVPCFVMITGALLLDPKREVSLQKLFKKYILRMVYALLIAIVVFRFIDVWMNHESISGAIFVNMIYQFFTNTSWSHLWYIYLLIGLYLILPAMKAITKTLNEKEIKYLLTVGFLFLSVSQLFNIWKFPFGFYIHVSTIYPFYFLLGYAIHNKIISLNRTKSIVLIFVSMILLILATHAYYLQNIANIDGLWGYNSVLVVLQSAGVFGLFQTITHKETKIVHILNSCTFGVYIFHMIIIRYLYRVVMVNPYNNMVATFTWMILLIIVLAFLFVYMIRLIPGIKRIF